MPDNDFYVGYFDKAPPSSARRTRLFVVAALLAALGVATLFVAFQGTFGSGVFEFGSPRTFEGVVRTSPVPHIESAEKDALLVAPFKHGADSLVSDLDGASVSLDGTLIEQADDRMIEIVPGTIETTGTSPLPREVVPLGRVTLVGEIVDSKCWLGVMKPGEGKVHRACATLCIKGGIPPLLSARDRDGNTLSAILVSPEGRPVNEAVLELVALPVRVSGQLERRGDILFLRADPMTIERLE